MGERMRNRRKVMQNTRKKEHRRLNAVWEELRDDMDKVISSADVPNSYVQDKNQPMVIVGSDVVSLFPCLKKQKVADICCESVLKSDIKWDGVDYLEGTRYIVLNRPES